jgi:hypothetical protein
MRRSLCTILALAWLAGCEQAGEATAQADPALQPPGGGRVAAEPASATRADAPPDEMPLDRPAEDAPVDPEVPAEPEVPVAPDDYGLIQPPVEPPSEDELTMKAVAGYEVVAVYGQPDSESARLGYLRIGTRTRATAKVEGTGCPKGWHALQGGGFACVGKGLLVGEKEPYLHEPPPRPSIDDPLPYEYAYVRKWNTPMYWRVPTPEEQRVADERRAVLEAQREGKPLPGETPPAAAAPGSGGSTTKDPSLADLPPPDAPAKAPVPKADPETPAADPAKPGADPAKPKAEPTKPAADPAKPKAEPAKPAEDPAAEEPEITLPLNPQTPWLEKGFFVSLAGKVHDSGKTWWRTARGAYLPASDAHKYGSKNEWVGVQLPAETDFPFGYAMAKETKVYALSEDGKLKAVDKLERRTFLDFTEETEIAGKAYMMTADGRLVRKDDVRIAERQPLPKGLQPWERWVDVSLEKQMLVAYEGDTPVYVTLVSTGRKGTKEESFETPTGRWRIRSKHISTTMDGDTASDGNYSIQDVPWAMFFEGSYALHGAFWHDGFGRVRSHGCVNLGPADARWLFFWTTPFLPEGWHGVHAHEGSPGTTVVVRQ